MINKLEQLLEDGQDNAILRFGLGSAYFKQKDFTAAIPHLCACLYHDETYTAAWKLLGKSYFRNGNLSAARQIFLSGLPYAVSKGDKQTEREINAFLKKIEP